MKKVRIKKDRWPSSLSWLSSSGGVWFTDLWEEATREEGQGKEG